MKAIQDSFNLIKFLIKKKVMKKILFATLAILFLFASCKKDSAEEQSVCDIEEPLVNIEWLKEIHFTFQASASPQANKIVQYTYQGECAFYIDNCVTCPDGAQYVYNELQEVLCEFGTIAGLNTCPDFFTEATDELVLWGD